MKTRFPRFDLDDLRREAGRVTTNRGGIRQFKQNCGGIIEGNERISLQNASMKNILFVGMSALLLLTVHAWSKPLPAIDRHLSVVGPSKAPDGAQQLCTEHGWACGQKGSLSLAEDRVLELAAAINRKVNASIRQVSDFALYGVQEKWTLPKNGAGDCEDIALMKKQMLLRAGLPGGRLFLAQVMKGWGGSHAVLVLRAEEGDYVLDNLNSSIRHWSRTGYTFVKMQKPSDKRRWGLVLMGPNARR